LTVSKAALKKLSNAAIDFDVRPHELVDAIVLNTNWEMQVEKLVKIIKDAREKGDGSETGPETGISTGHIERRVPTGLRRVSDGSETGPEKIEKSEKKTRDRPVSTSDGSRRVSEETKT